MGWCGFVFRAQRDSLRSKHVRCALRRADPGCFASPSGCIRPFIYLGELEIYRGRFDPRDDPPDAPCQVLAGRFVGWVCVSWNVFEPGTGPSPRVPRVEKVNEAG